MRRLRRKIDRIITAQEAGRIPFMAASMKVDRAQAVLDRMAEKAARHA
jgi:hypothetical protein